MVALDHGTTIRIPVNFRAGPRGRKVLAVGAEPSSNPAGAKTGRTPRVAKLMALAISLNDRVRGGEISDYADIARLGHVSRARASQIMGLLNLAPDIQEALLFLPEITRGRDTITERHLRPVVAIVDWVEQRRAWQHMLGSATSG